MSHKQLTSSLRSTSQSCS